MSRDTDNTKLKSRLNAGKFHQRARTHQSAHSESEIQTSPTAGNLPGVYSGEPEMVTTQRELERTIDHLRQAGVFAYDSEFIGERSYVPQLCLLQVASTQTVALIDPLADLNLDPFWELLCEPGVLKILHAGEQDVEPVFRHIHKSPENLFDTQIAAGLVGLPYPISLAKLVHHYSGAQLGKGLTFTHWDQRPLTSMQLRYAADDVRYLPAVYAALQRELAHLNHLDWARDESAELCRRGVYTFDPETSYLRTRGAAGLAGHSLAILKELSIWRDATARLHDVPPRTLVRDEIMVAMAKNPVRSIDKLDRIKGLPRPVEVEHGQEIVAATLRALAKPADNFAAPTMHEPTPQEKYFTDALWSVAQAWCYARQIDPGLVTSRQEVGELAREWQKGNDVSNSPVMSGWRRKALGEVLLKVLNDKQAVSLVCDDRKFHAHLIAP